MFESFTPLLLARLQMAFTLGFHIIVACFGVGFPVLLLTAEYCYLRTGDEIWKTLARRWSKVFVVLFAVGAVSGTVLSFELGLLWPKFMGTFGGVIGLPFTLEGFAFFLEAIFAGIYLYGWDRLSPRAHWWSGVPIAIAGVASAWFVVTANAWMNTPSGFTMLNGIVTDADPIAAMLSPATPTQTVHMILAAYMVAGFCVASVYAVSWLKGTRSRYHIRALWLALGLAVVPTPFQAVVGDFAGKMVAKYQPVKLAALEGQLETQAGAPLRLGGLPDVAKGVTRYALEIPGGLSWMAHGDRHAIVQGLNEIPKDNQPPVLITHLAFQAMVGMGTFLLFLSFWTLFSVLRKRRLPESQLYFFGLAVSGFAAVLALEAGWVVTEVGRQPWIAYRFMKTADAVTSAPGVGFVFLGTLLIYAILAVGTLFVLRLLAKKPLPDDNYVA